MANVVVFLLVGKTEKQILGKRETKRIRIKCCRISKISKEVGRIDKVRALARKLSFLPTELDIFNIRQHYVLILFIFQRLIC